MNAYCNSYHYQSSLISFRAHVTANVIGLTLYFPVLDCSYSCAKFALEMEYTKLTSII